MAGVDTIRPNGEQDGGVEADALMLEVSPDTMDAPQLELGDDDVRLPWLESDDDDEDYQPSGAGQLITLLLIGLVAIGAIVGGVWWFTRAPADPALVADGGVIEAPAQPYKERPANPGGKTFEGTGDTSFAVSEGQTRPARLGEGPVAKPAAASPAAPAAAPSGAASPEPASDGPGVQVAAYSTRPQAEAGWTRLSQQYEALSGVSHRIVEGRADIGTVYRLQALPGDLGAARALCGKLKSAGLPCQVKN